MATRKVFKLKPADLGKLDVEDGLKLTVTVGSALMTQTYMVTQGILPKNIVLNKFFENSQTCPPANTCLYARTSRDNPPDFYNQTFPRPSERVDIARRLYFRRLDYYKTLLSSEDSFL